MLAAVALAVCAAGCTHASQVAADAPSATTSTVTPTASPRTTVGPSATPAPSFQVTVDPIHAPWADAIDATIGGRDMSVAVGLGDRIVYSHLGDEPRVLASNEKLLTSMAALAEGIQKALLVPGLKLNVKGKMLVSLNAIITMHNNGLHSTVTPVVGVNLTM